MAWLIMNCSLLEGIAVADMQNDISTHGSLDKVLTGICA
jgi:hypothetical protein